jgi:glycolate oxidase
LREALGSNKVLTSIEDRIAYSYDGAFAQDLPDVAVLPESTEEVATVVRIAAEHRVPVVPRGMASGLAAASVPFSGGIALSLTRMNRILELDEENRTVWVEAGIITADLQAYVEPGGCSTRPTHPATSTPPSAATSPATPEALAASSTGSPATT